LMHRLRLENVGVILVRPAIAGNIGATARVLKNFGLSSFILVDPQTSPSHPEAIARASGATDVLEKVVVYTDLETALAPFQYVVGTTCKKRYKKTRYFPREIAPLLTAISQQNKIALLFGPERTGLTNADLNYCHTLITIPTAPAHPSLNLSHAVAVVMYELFCQAMGGGVSWSMPSLATAAQLEAMYGHLIQSLSKIGFVLGGEKGHTYRVLKRLFSKIPLTEADVRVIRGICRQIDWFSQQK